jgi:murein DD-endopeptidase MepM/ murein hydrolase activator NlpD
MLEKEVHNASNVWRHHFPRHHLVAACGISLALTLLLSVLPDSVVAYRTPELVPEQPIQPALPAVIEATATTQVATPPPAQMDPWLHLTVRKGDTLSSLLQKAGLSLDDIHLIANSGQDAKHLTSLDLGDQIDLLIKDGKVEQLKLTRSKLESVAVVRNGDSYESEHLLRTPEVRHGYASGVIDSSLFVAGQKAGLNDRMTLKLADIFAYDIDFLLDIQPGDSFAVMYEEHYLDGERVGEGNILAAEFTNQGKTYRAVQYKSSDGTTAFYSPEGEVLRKQFLRTPVDFAKITSYFSLSRKHPILHKIRAHKGIDYGAPRGTPIRAAGDGKVVFAGIKNGYGNVVMIQHGAAYTTLYGHMDKISVKNGTKVGQGQMIGTVGSTGLATGPHLHYEFHVNGSAVNPLANKNVAIAEPLSKAEKARFSNSANALLSEMKQLASAKQQKAQQVAMNTSEEPRANPIQ